MDLQNAIRNSPRFPIQWPTLYGAANFIANGTVLDLSLMGCRLAGTMPPDQGLRLHLWVYPSQRERGIYVEEARVKWISDEQFGLEFVKIQTQDLQWLMGYLDRAERRNSFRGAGHTHDLATMPLALPLKD